MAAERPTDEAGSLMEMEPIQESQPPKVEGNRLRALRTVCIYLGFMCLGLCDSVLGPTFADIQTLLATDTARLSAVFTATNVGYLGGSAVAGVLFDRLSPEPQLALALGVAAVAIAAAPAQGGLATFVIAMAIEGAGLAYIDAGTQAYCLSVWRGHRFQDAVVQGIFMVWSVGSTLGPLILRPFLTSSQLDNGTTKGLACSTESYTPDVPATVYPNITFTLITHLNDSHLNSTDVLGLPEKGDLSVGFGYMVIGLILLPVSLLYLITFFIARSSKTERTDEVIDPTHTTKELSFKYILLIIIFSIFFLVYVGQEVTFGGFLALFVRRGLCWTNQQSAALTSLFWSCTGIGRLLGVPVSMYLRPVHMLVMNLTLSMAALLVLATLAGEHPAVMWGVAVVTGLGVSTVYPSAYLWCSRYVKVTGRVTGVFLFGGSIGSMTLPLITGILIDNVSPWTFTHLLAGTGVVLLLIHLSVWVYTSRHMEVIQEDKGQQHGSKSNTEDPNVTVRLT